MFLGHPETQLLLEAFASLRRTVVMCCDIISLGHHILFLIGKKARPWKEKSFFPNYEQN